MTITIGFFFVEIITGYVTNSMSLVADSFHMLGDIAALLISFLSVKVGSGFFITAISIYLIRFSSSDVAEKVEQEHIRMGSC